MQKGAKMAKKNETATISMLEDMLKDLKEAYVRLENREKALGSRIWERMVRAAKSLQRNPILLLPDFVMFLITYVMTITLYNATGMRSAMQAALMPGEKTQVLSRLLFATWQFTAANWAHIITAVCGFVVVTFMLGVGIETIRYGLIRQCADGKKASFIEAWKTRNGYFRKIVAMKILVYLLFSGAIILLAMLSLLAYGIGLNIGGISLGWVTFLLAFILFVFLTIGLLYRYAILFFENTSSTGAIRLSFLYLRCMTRHVVYTWIIISIISVGFWLLAALASIGMGKLQASASSSSVTVVYFISFMTAFIAFVLKLFYSLWADIFVFSSYAYTKEYLQK